MVKSVSVGFKSIMAGRSPAQRDVELPENGRNTGDFTADPGHKPGDGPFYRPGYDLPADSNEIMSMETALQIS